MPFLKRLLFLILIAFFCSSSAWADFGNRFIANQRLETTLNSADRKISFRFTCQDDMTLTAAAVYCVQALDSPAYSLSLQEDVKGLPSGTALDSTSYTPRTQSWATLPLDSVPLIQGKVYHLVLEADLLQGGYHPVGVLDSSHYASFLSTDVLNHLHPNDQSPDPKANTLFMEKGKWRELNQEPVYAVYGTGSHFQGNPYDDPGIRPIFGKILQGQVLHFHCGYPVQALSFRVRKKGNPAMPLNYRILAHNYRAHVCHTLTTGVVLPPEKAPSHFEWVTVGGLLPEASTFPAECYYFVLQSDSGQESKNPADCENCYQISDVGHSGGLAHGSDLTFDGGAHLSRVTRSLDGGDPSHWIDEFTRDANLRAIGPICPSSGSRELAPLPTPLPISNERRYEP